MKSLSRRELSCMKALRLRCRLRPLRRFTPHGNVSGPSQERRDRSSHEMPARESFPAGARPRRRLPLEKGLRERRRRRASLSAGAAEPTCAGRWSIRAPTVQYPCPAPRGGITIGADRDDDGDRDDAVVLGDLHVGRVDPQIRPVAFDRAVEDSLHAGRFPRTSGSLGSWRCRSCPWP